MTRYGDFGTLCRNVPSFPVCNLFFRQLLDQREFAALGLTASTPNQSFTPDINAGILQAGVGVDPVCAIPRVAQGLGDGNVAQIVFSAVSAIVVAGLIARATLRVAAVGRTEFRVFLATYFVILVLQIFTTGSFLEQGTTAIAAITAVQLALTVSLFWALFANAVISTQFIEDGTMASLVPFAGTYLILFGGSLYVCLDIAFGFTNFFRVSASDVGELHSAVLFSIVLVWPLVAVLLYAVVIGCVVLGVLKENKPLIFFLVTLVFFVLSELDTFLLSKTICENTNRKVDGAFVATALQTLSVTALYFAWRSITEDSWDDLPY